MSEPSAPAPRPEPVDAPLQLGVLIFQGAEELDAIGPATTFWALRSVRPFLPPFRPAVVHLVAESPEPVRCGNGTVVLPTTTYADGPPLDVLVVPGGTARGDTPAAGRRFQQRHQPTLDFVKATAGSGGLVASVCTGAFVLAGAGLLAGRRATTHWTARQELVELMAARGEHVELVPERVVDAGEVVTAGGVSAGIDLGLHLVRRVLGDEVAGAVALAIEVETPPGDRLVS